MRYEYKIPLVPPSNNKYIGNGGQAENIEYQAEKCECFKDCHKDINDERLKPAADVAKVVSCKDCKHYEFSTAFSKHFCNEYGGFVTENDYCSRAEKSNEIIREV